LSVVVTQHPAQSFPARRVEQGDADAVAVAISVLRLEDWIEGDRQFMEVMAHARASRVLTEAACFRKAALLTRKAITAQMTNMPGRRIIAIFSDGFTLQDTGGGTQTNEVQSVISSAARSGVTIYSIHAKGLTALPIFDASMRGGAAELRLQSYLSASDKDQQDGPHALAADTGGTMYMNTNDLGDALGRALNANRYHYVLAYYLDSGRNIGQFRRITVRVKNHPEYQVQTPKGFLPADIMKVQTGSDAKTRQQRLLQAILAPLPATALSVSASADFIETETDNAQVLLTVLFLAHDKTLDR
jgi:VWFA-related protein